MRMSIQPQVVIGTIMKLQKMEPPRPLNFEAPQLKQLTRPDTVTQVQR